MYLDQPNNVDGFKESLAKVRKTVHKIFPRELSPSRLAEKYGSDAKKKGVAKVAKATAVSIQHAATNDQLLAMQINTLNAALPENLDPADEFTVPAPATLIQNKVDSIRPWLIGGGVLGLLALVYRSSRQ